MAQKLRTLKVEERTYFRPTSLKKDTHGVIRLKGKWLGEFFSPGERVVVESTTCPDGSTALLIHRPFPWQETVTTLEATE